MWKLTSRRPILDPSLLQATLSRTFSTAARVSLALRTRKTRRWLSLKHPRARRAALKSVSAWMTTSPWIYCTISHPRSRVSFSFKTSASQYLTSSSGASNARRRKPGQDAAHFKTDEDTGRMVIDEKEDEEEGNAHLDVAGTAYKESMTSVDGFTRGPNGKVKFNKDTKKRRREEAEDVEMGDVEAGPRKKKDKKKATEPRVGQEFKAKVCSPSSEVFLTVLMYYRGLAESWRRRQKGWCRPIRLPLPWGSSEEREEGEDRHHWKAIGYIFSFLAQHIRHMYSITFLPIQALVMGRSKQTCFPRRRCFELAVGYRQL